MLVSELKLNVHVLRVWSFVIIFVLLFTGQQRCEKDVAVTHVYICVCVCLCL